MYNRMKSLGSHCTCTDNVFKDVLIILPKASSEIAAFLTKHFLSVQYSISKGLFARVWMKNDRCKSL